jgi:hypothetical protein
MKIFFLVLFIYFLINILVFFKVGKPTFKNLVKILFFGPWLFYLKSKSLDRPKSKFYKDIV